MKRSERCKRGLSDESDSCFLAEMCPDVTTVGSFHQGPGVKGRRMGGRIDLLYRGVDTTGACDTHTRGLYNSSLSIKSLLSFRFPCSSS